jgi:hypothetical protein
LSFLAVLLGVLGYVLSRPHGLDTADKLGSVGALILGALMFVIGNSPPRPVHLDERSDDLVAAELSRLAHRQWAREAAVRLVRRPEPLAVGWSLAGDARPAADPGVRSAWSAPRPVPHGDITDLAAVFRGLPAGRLLILGAAGSGKSVAALLLTLDLLAVRGPDEAVPVLLAASCWHPGEHFETWLARRLAEDYPTLNASRHGERPLPRLVAAGRVLPVLDGLDEMPLESTTAVLEAFNTGLAGRPVIMTCRSSVYARAVARTGTPLDGAVAIELAPITAEAAAGYLPGGQVDGVRRWAPVIAELRGHPGGPVAQALSTSLMVYLVRTAYAAPTTAPADLLDAARFPDRTSVEEHLLDRYLPAVYAAETCPPDPALAGSARHGYDAGRARAWLAFLATRLPAAEGGDLAWWNLPRCVARWRALIATVAGSMAGTASGLAAGIGTTLVAGSGWGLFAGLTAGLCSGAMCAWGYSLDRPTVLPRHPHRVRPRLLRALLVPTRPAVIRSVQCALALGVQAGIFVGIGMGFQRDAGTGLAYGCSTALLVSLPVGAVEYIAQQLTSVPGEADWVSPRSSLAGDRAASLLHACVGALLFGPTFGVAAGVLTDARTGLAAGLATAACAVLGSAAITGIPPEWLRSGGLRWVPFGIARAWLALRGRVPFRLLWFFEDAHARGVLRQNGATYQFRHARVREHLTAIPAVQLHCRKPDSVASAAGSPARVGPSG